MAGQSSGRFPFCFEAAFRDNFTLCYVKTMTAEDTSVPTLEVEAGTPSSCQV